MTDRRRSPFFWLGVAALALAPLSVAHGQSAPSSSDRHGIDGASLIQPDALAKLLQSSKSVKPLVFYIGFRALYVRHIPGADYIGPTSEARGIQQLRARVNSLPRTRALVLYCGCCPWEHCPNVAPAYRELRSMGFSNVKVLYLATNFGTDWVAKGYPVERSE